MPDVPALSRGLLLLEILAQAEGPVTFGDLFARLNLPRASVARMIAALHADGWIERPTEAGWQPGARVRALAGPVSAAERLRAVALPIIRPLHRDLGVSVLVAQPRGAVLDVVISETAEEGIALRAVGSTVQDLSHGPWGGAAYAHSDERTRELARTHTDAAGIERLQIMRDACLTAGYVLDDSGARGLLRLAVPVLRQGKLLAILGIGAPIGALVQPKNSAVQLIQAAATLATALGDLA